MLMSVNVEKILIAVYVLIFSLSSFSLNEPLLFATYIGKIRLIIRIIIAKKRQKFKSRGNE
jgi:ABC-type transport system involved in cytochrome bd biosynthesis fused ATPase/permease subunit